MYIYIYIYVYVYIYIYIYIYIYNSYIEPADKEVYTYSCRLVFSTTGQYQVQLGGHDRALDEGLQ